MGRGRRRPHDTLPGEPTGYVDLGALGLADRWSDLALATWSTVWNHGGPGFEFRCLAAYGVEADPVRTAYHRALRGDGAGVTMPGVKSTTRE